LVDRGNPSQDASRIPDPTIPFLGASPHPACNYVRSALKLRVVLVFWANFAWGIQISTTSQLKAVRSLRKRPGFLAVFPLTVLLIDFKLAID